MRRLLTTSALFALAILTTAATGQPPTPAGKAPPNDLIKEAQQRELIEKQREKAVADAAIAAALANDPDVKMAKAKLQLAEAELAKARQAVTLKVVMLKAKVEQHKAQLAPLEDQMRLITAAFKAGSAGQAELLSAREKLEAAKAALALAETELKLLTGSADPAAAGLNPDPNHDRTVARAIHWLATQQAGDGATAVWDYYRLVELARERLAVKGPIPDRIRAALDKPIKLAEKGQAIQFQAAVDAFKKANLDIPFRQKATLEVVTSEGEELPMVAWLQLFLDSNPGVVMVVREYGILIVKKADAPPDALGVMEFWKQKPAPSETKSEPKTEGKVEPKK